jgi:hypothetical protein
MKNLEDLTQRQFILIIAAASVIVLSLWSAFPRYRTTCSTSNGYRCVKVDRWTGNAYAARSREWVPITE